MTLCYINLARIALKYISEISQRISHGPYIEYFRAGKGPICAQKKKILCDLNQSDSVKAISTKINGRSFYLAIFFLHICMISMILMCFLCLLILALSTF